MAIKISALIMSGNTALITTGFVIYIHAKPHGHFVTQWLSAFVSVWPVVFLAISPLASGKLKSDALSPIFGVVPAMLMLLKPKKAISKMTL